MPAKRSKKKINLAIQGGGAHGAFAWGVLDALLEDGRLSIDGLSATSAGAMNASVYAYGMMTGGVDGAREALESFWRDVSRTGKSLAGVPDSAMDMVLFGGHPLDNPLGYFAFESFTRLFSPYQFNPLNLNPLKDILLKHVDFDVLVTCECVQLFVCATNVKTNRIKVFQNKEISADAVMASACLPMLFQAVEVGGEYYWDGGYMGNPALYPLFYHTETDDMVVVHINPIEREELPTTPHEIVNRVNEVSFNSSLLREFRAIAFIQRMLEEGWIKDEFRHHITHETFYMHAIRADGIMNDYSVASKFSPNWEFLCDLRDKGREAAEEWLSKNYRHIGKKSTMDIRGSFLKS